MKFTKHKELWYLLFIATLCLISSCSFIAEIARELKGKNTEFEPKPMAYYQEQGTIFLKTTTFKEYENSYLKKTKEGLLSCKKNVDEAEREEKLLNKPSKKGCQMLHYGNLVNGIECCEALYQNKLLTKPTWIKFKNSFQEGDVLYYIGKRSVKGHVGYTGLAIVRNEVVINIYYSVVS